MAWQRRIAAFQAALRKMEHERGRYDCAQTPSQIWLQELSP